MIGAERKNASLQPPEPSIRSGSMPRDVPSRTQRLRRRAFPLIGTLAALSAITVSTAAAKNNGSGCGADSKAAHHAHHIFRREPKLPRPYLHLSEFLDAGEAGKPDNLDFSLLESFPNGINPQNASVTFTVYKLEGNAERTSYKAIANIHEDNTNSFENGIGGATAQIQDVSAGQQFRVRAMTNFDLPGFNEPGYAIEDFEFEINSSGKGVIDEGDTPEGPE